MALHQSHFNKTNKETTFKELIVSHQINSSRYFMIYKCWTFMIFRKKLFHEAIQSAILKIYHTSWNSTPIQMPKKDYLNVRSWGFSKRGRRENRMFLCRNTYPSLCHLNGGGIEVYTGSNGEALKTHGSLQ